MRIIAGRLGGRNFDAPKGRRTHPMSEKARGGLFSALGDIEGLRVLDAFAGSGAISFEAISRGASHVTAIDVDSNAFESIKNNAEKLKLGKNIKVMRANNSGWSNNNPDEKFDIVVCDPPFDDIIITLIQKLSRHLNPSGVLILCLSSSLKPFELKGLQIIKTKNYGDATLVFYKKMG